MAPIPYIRTTAADDAGARPIAPGVNYYATPAIRIHNPADGNQGKAVALAETPQFVVVEVSNRGDTAPAGQLAVQVWACGFGTASGFAGTLGGAQGRQTLAPQVPAGSGNQLPAVEVSTPWTPQNAEVGGDERHFCIRANVYDLNNPGDKLNDGNAVDVPANARHAQRNMTLVAIDSESESFSFDLATANPNPKEAQEFRLDIVEVTGELEPEELFGLHPSAWTERTEGGFALRGTHGEIALAPAFDAPARGVTLDTGVLSEEKIELSLRPEEECWITMRVAFGELRDGLVHRFDITQRGRDGIVGAARVMTLAVPTELLDRDGEDRYGKAD